MFWDMASPGLLLKHTFPFSSSSPFVWQIELVVDGSVPSDLGEGLVVDRSELARLEQRIQQLKVEKSHQRDLKVHARHHHSKLLRECKDMKAQGQGRKLTACVETQYYVKFRCHFSCRQYFQCQKVVCLLICVCGVCLCVSVCVCVCL